MELLVRNTAASAVRLANCLESYSVAAGGNATVPLSNLSNGSEDSSVLWVVPEEVEWNCSTGPFDLFYVLLNVSGSGPAASMGFGLMEEMASSSTINSTEGTEEEVDRVPPQAEGANATNSSIASVDGLAMGSHGVAGVELSALGVAARCREDVCGEDVRDPMHSESLVFTIRGFDERVLSFWYGGPPGPPHRQAWGPFGPRPRRPWRRCLAHWYPGCMLGSHPPHW